MARVLLATGWMVTYSYLVEAYVAWYSGDRYERFTHLVDRPTGPYAFLFWLTIACNCLTPQLLWWRRVRRSPVALWFASLAIQLGMWCERYVLIVTAQHRDFLPSSWRDYTPTWVEGGILAGTVSLFLFLFLLFLRLVPFVPVSELKALGRELSREEAR